ncbi:unnamed protein product [Sympodiomycopsis kandeliae]
MIAPRTAAIFGAKSQLQLQFPRSLASARQYATTQGSSSTPTPPHLLTLADLSTEQIQSILTHSMNLKQTIKADTLSKIKGAVNTHEPVEQTLQGKSIAIMFSKRSTRTRVASETSIAKLGGTPMFLGPSDIQLGVNESLYDTAKVISSMVDGIMARVGHHDEIVTLAKNSTVPVINALSHQYHPTQILADLLTMLETYGKANSSDLSSLAGLKVAWVGDSNNILNDMLVAFPRLGINLSVATPKGYDRDEQVWGRMQDGISAQRQKGSNITLGNVEWTNDPAIAVKDADILVTDTWISMGDESSKEQRLKDFAGFQITEEMARKGNAKPDWKFMHCLPRKSQEVDDQVFYSTQRSLVFPEAENRKWTIMALFDQMFGKWKL